jgi:phytoene synthase
MGHSPRHAALALRAAARQGRAVNVGEELSPRAVGACRAVMAEHAKSFDFAARLLGAEARDVTAVVYAHLRRVDDAIDEAPASERPAVLARMRRELDVIYGDGGGPLPETERAFRVVVKARRIPRLYLDELLEGMAMDASAARYETDEDLFRYCHRAAGVVGLLMCHVFGLRDDAALVRAAHLGWAMQLTNICRDVAEDWALGRRYLPAARYRALGVEPPEPDGGVFPAAAAPVTRAVVGDLLASADRYYESGRRGLPALPWRVSTAVHAASRIYRAIGDELARRDHDPLIGRVWVSTPRKARLLVGAVAERLARGPRRDRRPIRAPTRVLRFEEAWRAAP